MKGKIREGYSDISHPEGWNDIVNKLDEYIYFLDPGYTIAQTKEKFGGLRFYPDLSEDLSRIVMANIYDAISEAETDAANTCDVCGKSGALRTGSWLVTRCDEHA